MGDPQLRLNAMRQTCQELAMKINELDLDSTEHSLVMNALQPLDPKRKCFRMVGGVVVERTVEEVLPAVQKNKEQACLRRASASALALFAARRLPPMRRARVPRTRNSLPLCCPPPPRPRYVAPSPVQAAAARLSCSVPSTGALVGTDARLSTDEDAKTWHFFRVCKRAARAARGARSAPEGRREAPRSGAGCRAAAQSAAAGG